MLPLPPSFTTRPKFSPPFINHHVPCHSHHQRFHSQSHASFSDSDFHTRLLEFSSFIMGIENRNGAHRAWKMVRLVLLWARKGGVFKRRLVTEMRLLPKYLRRLTHNTPPTPSHIYYCERQLSFDKTPMFNRPSSMRFHLPHIPCINPHVDFEYDGDDDVRYDNGEDGDEQCRYQQCDEEDDQGIDVRAEEFIAKFYQQMKLQRQISYLQYNETPTRLSC